MTDHQKVVFRFGVAFWALLIGGPALFMAGGALRLYGDSGLPGIFLLYLWPIFLSALMHFWWICRHSGKGVSEVFPSVVILQTMVVSPLVILYPIYVRFEKNEIISGMLGQWGWRVLFLAGIALVFWLPTTRYFAPLLKPGDKTLFIMIPILPAFPFVLSNIIMTIVIYSV